MAMYSHPTPTDPYNPYPPPDSQEMTQYPSPFIPVRLPIFAAVIWLNDAVVRILSVGMGVTGSKAVLGHGRSFSTAEFENAEEGETVELRAVGSPKTPVKSRFSGLNQGSRKKKD